MSGTLGNFLRARLDEDAVVAREAREAAMSDGNLTERDLATRSGRTWQIYGDVDNEWGASDAVCMDVSRVLADVEAKRRIVDRETGPRRMRPGFPYVTSIGPDGQALIPEWAADHGASQYSEYAITDPDEVAAEIEAWSDPIVDTPILRLLALPYADHPDYDESWRP